MKDSPRPTPRIVAVDGPAGSGKSSICASVCKRIGWSYVNTGALYRAIAVLAHDRGISLVPSKEAADSNVFQELLEEFEEKASWRHDEEQLLFGDINITPRLGSIEAATGASLVAKMPMVRRSLMPLQRKLALSAPRGAMVDGRDIGTVIFPDADLKIFMTASLEERAMRRMRQLEKENRPGTLTPQEIMESIAFRDSQDSQRDEAPLKQAEDAVVFDTSHLNLSAAVDSLTNLLKTRGLF